LLVAVGEGGTILRSEDGDHWTAIESGTNEALNAVAAADNNTFWAVGNRGTALKSGDGGRTWAATQPLSSRDLMSVELTDAAHGFAVGQRGVSQLLSQ
jgi:photosystem II stability/assembly factor-like uncharacterized protein